MCALNPRYLTVHPSANPCRLPAYHPCVQCTPPHHHHYPWDQPGDQPGVHQHETPITMLCTHTMLPNPLDLPEVQALASV